MENTHDLRNKLAVIYSYAQMLELMLQKPELAEEHASAEALVRSLEEIISSL